MNEGKTGGGVLGKLGVKARGNLAFRQASVRVDIIRQLHACMREQHVGRAELADKSGKNREEVTRLFSGVLPFTLDDLVSLAHALGARVEVRLLPAQELERIQIQEDEGEPTAEGGHDDPAMTFAEPMESIEETIEAIEAIPETVGTPLKSRPEPAATDHHAPAMTAVEAIEAIEAVDMMHGMKDSASRFLAEMQSAYQKERRERERRPNSAGPQKTGSSSGAFPPSARALSSPFHGVDVLNSMAGMEDMKDHDRQFLDDMQRAYHRESRERLSGGPENSSSARSTTGLGSRSLEVDIPEAVPGMDEEAQDHDQEFLDDMRAALEEGAADDPDNVFAASAPEEAVSDGESQDEEDASVVMAALAEMSGEDKNFMEEMWAAVQQDGGRRGPKTSGAESAASAPKKTP